jgi:4-hydroxy-tetrahydrodipicolinate synthase
MSGNNTADLAGKIATADLKGVAAILSATPYYNKPSQEGLYSHYKAVASFSPVPVILYNVPSRTGVNMEAATTLRLAQDFENIIGIKEAHNNTEQMAALIKGRPAGFYVLSGDDMTAAELIGMGGDGLISVPANAYPAEMKRLVDAAINGRRAEVTEMVGRMYPMIHLMFKEGSPTGIKAVLAMKGMIRNELRLPLVPASDTLCEQMKRVMAEERL